MVRNVYIFMLLILKQNSFHVFFLGNKHYDHMKILKLLHIPRIMSDPVESRMLVLLQDFPETSLDHSSFDT